MEIIVEKLTLKFFLFHLLPEIKKNRSIKIVYIDDSVFFRGVKSIFVRLFRISFKRYYFLCSEIFGEDGMSLRLAVHYKEMNKCLKYIEDDDLSKQKWRVNSPSFKLFIRKKILPGKLVVTDEGIWRNLYLIHVCINDSGINVKGNMLILNNYSGTTGFNRYISELEKNFVVKLVQKNESICYAIFLQFQEFCIELIKLCLVKFRTIGVVKVNQKKVKIQTLPQIAVPSYGMLNINKPEYHSELFFWQNSDLKGENITTLHALPYEPISDNLKESMDLYRITPLVLNHGVTKRTDISSYIMPRLPLITRTKNKKFSNGLKKEMLDFCEFESKKKYWQVMFKKYCICTYVSWYKYTHEHCVIKKALEEIDGTLAMYQRSFEGNYCAETSIVSDIMFGYSALSYETEKKSDSMVDYYIITGYLGDHRTTLVKKSSEKVRKYLQKNGAQYIAAFFDEGASADGRWWTGPEVMQREYGFLLDKVLDDSKFGLILKPKTPTVLKARLGDVYKKLETAVNSGRCFIYNKGEVQGNIVPTQAALSADLVIHNSVAAATAGIESVLVGKRTVFLDEDNFFISPIHEFKNTEVIFYEWEELWSAWKQYRETPKAMNYFGNLTPMLDDLDPFRDGKAAKRMGTYLEWVVEGYRNKLPKSIILADAAERYARQWGRDKVLTVN